MTPKTAIFPMKKQSFSAWCNAISFLFFFVLFFFLNLNFFRSPGNVIQQINYVLEGISVPKIDPALA